MKRQYEQRLKSSTGSNRTKLIDIIKKIDAEINKVFTAQRTMKDALGIDNGNNQAKWGMNEKIFNSNNLALASTLIDNAGNYFLNKKLREKPLPKPDLLPIRSLDTMYDIEPSLKAIDMNTANANNLINDNIANSNVQLGAKLAMLNSNTQSKLPLYQTKTNTETGLRNLNKTNISKLEEFNNQLMNDYKMNKFNKEVQTDYSNPSKNLENLQGDIRWNIDNKNLTKYQDLQLAANALKNSDTGVDSKFLAMYPEYFNIGEDELNKRYKNAVDKNTKNNLEIYAKAKGLTIKK